MGRGPREGVDYKFVLKNITAEGNKAGAFVKEICKDFILFLPEAAEGRNINRINFTLNRIEVTMTCDEFN